MKAGIITFQRADNYGSLLQCYALYKTVEELGIDTEVVDYRNPYIERAYTGLPNLRKNLFLWAVSAIKRMLNYNHVMKKHKEYLKLIEQIKFSKGYTKKEIVKNGLNYDIIFTGSDQIWNPAMTNGFDDVYFLNFPSNCVKCAYAASLGNSDNKDFKKEKFARLLKNIDCISMREQSACETVNKYTNKKCGVCVDPTLLLKREKWDELADQSQLNLSGDYIVLYYLDGNTQLIKMAEFLAKKHNAKIICCNKTPINSDNITWLGDLGPTDFLKLIRGAKAVVASSFHAAVFSVVFNKPLYAILHPETGERAKTLADICGFSSRLYKSYDDFKKKYSEDDKISYDYDNLNREINNSINYIKNAVEFAK